MRSDYLPSTGVTNVENQTENEDDDLKDSLNGSEGKTLAERM